MTSEHNDAPMSEGAAGADNVRGPEHPAYGPSETVPHPQGGRKRGRTPLIAATAAGLLVVGGGAFATMKLMSHGEQPDTVIPGNAAAFVRLDLDPSAGQKIAAFRLLDKLPQTKASFTSQDPKKGVFELLKKGSSAMADLDYDKDVAPWMGDRFAAALVPGKDGKGVPIVAMAITDEGKARDGIAKLAERARKTAKDVESKAPGGSAVSGIDTQEETVNVFRKGYVLSIPKSSEQDVTSALDAGSIATKDAYLADMKELGEPGVASAWYDPKAVAALTAKASNASTSGAANPLADTPLTKAISEKQKPFAMAVRLSSDNVEIVANGADPGWIPAASKVRDLTHLPTDTAAFVSAAGVGDAVGALWQPMIDTMTKTTPNFTRQLDDFQARSGLSLPGDVQTLLGRQVDVIMPQSLFQRDKQPSIGVRFDTDPAKAEAVVAKVETLTRPSSSGAPSIPRKVVGSRLVFGISEADAAHFAENGELGLDSPLGAALPDLESARMAAYIDLDRIESAYLDDVPADYRDAVRSMRAFGYTVAVKNGREISTTRLVLN